jgi:methionine salvage enolase-phosphatase E1
MKKVDDSEVRLGKLELIIRQRARVEAAKTFDELRTSLWSMGYADGHALAKGTFSYTDKDDLRKLLDRYFRQQVGPMAEYTAIIKFLEENGK